jgi:hypothetical protein
MYAFTIDPGGKPPKGEKRMTSSLFYSIIIADASFAVKHNIAFS